MFSARANGRRAGLIVCGIDGSRVARQALQAAEGLRDRLGLSLLAAHVVSPVPVRARPWAGPGASATVEDLASGEALLQEECAAAAIEQAERRVLVGRPAERLAELADDRDADLVVVGSRGHRQMPAAVMGSVSTELLGLAPCPVLVVPARAVDWQSENS